MNRIKASAVAMGDIILWPSIATGPVMGCSIFHDPGEWVSASDGEHVSVGGAVVSVVLSVTSKTSITAEHWHLIPDGIEFEDADGNTVEVLMPTGLYASLAARLWELLDMAPNPEAGYGYHMGLHKMNDYCADDPACTPVFASIRPSVQVATDAEGNESEVLRVPLREVFDQDAEGDG